MLLPQQHLPPLAVAQSRRPPAAVAGSVLPLVSAGSAQKAEGVSGFERRAGLAALATAVGALAGGAPGRRRLGRTTMRIGLRDTAEQRLRAGLGRVGEDGEEEGLWGPAESMSRKMHMEQLQTINNRLRHRKRKKGAKLRFTGKTANPWRDRYMVCKCCGIRSDEGKRPIKGCQASTLMEVDMTMPFTRDNVVVVSCDMVQLVSRDKRVIKYADGTFRPALSRDEPGAFRVRVCANCRKTSIDEGREFKMCEVCEGVSYCSEECFAQDRLRHRATCTIPWLPYRAFWGIHGGLREMRKEILPLMKHFCIREPSDHRIPWLPVPQHAKLLPEPEPVKISLPGFGSQRRKLLPDRCPIQDVEIKEGAVVHVPSSSFSLRAPRALRPSREPDETHLMLMGMTREEWLEKDADLQAAAAEEDARLMKAYEGQKLQIRKAEVPKAPLLLKELEDRGGCVTPGFTLPQAPLERLELSEEGVERLQEAGALATKDPRPEKELPPWSRPGFLEAQGGVSSLRPDVPLPEERKDGVVYAESFARKVNRVKDLRLPEEAIKRLEAVTALTKHTAKQRKFALGMPKIDPSHRIFGHRRGWENAAEVVRRKNKSRAKQQQKSQGGDGGGRDAGAKP